MDVMQLIKVAEDCKNMLDDLYDLWDERTNRKEPALLKSEILPYLEKNINHMFDVERASTGIPLPKETKEWLMWAVLTDLKEIGMLKETENDQVTTPTFIH